MCVCEHDVLLWISSSSSLILLSHRFVGSPTCLAWNLVDEISCQSCDRVRCCLKTHIVQVLPEDAHCPTSHYLCITGGAKEDNVRFRMFRISISDVAIAASFDDFEMTKRRWGICSSWAAEGPTLLIGTIGTNSMQRQASSGPLSRLSWRLTSRHWVKRKCNRTTDGANKNLDSHCVFLFQQLLRQANKI